MPDGGTITVETGNTVFDEPYTQEHFDLDPGPYVMLAVSDTGVGMDRPTREHVFEPFFTTKEPGKGTGLGLATIYGIVRQARGHVWLYSEPGHGSAFKLYFPRVDAEPREESTRSRQLPAGGGAVLLVEDDATVRDMTTQLLERAGYRVTAVEDGQRALETFAQLAGRIDALVTDVIMPGMTGLALAEQILDMDPSVRVVLLSGYTAETLDLTRLMERGATFVAKPITARQLVAAIQGGPAATAAADPRDASRA